ncbi:MAG: ATP-binding protein [Candidatus Omnitrophica bacterium]|nr:ATP-binding protein [Candidatus Omnitrophota bacterium]
MLHYAFSGFLVFLTSSVLGFIVFIKNPKRLVNLLFVLFSLSVAAYGFGFYKQALSLSPAQELHAVRILLAGTIFIPVFFLHLVSALLSRKISKKLLACFYLSAGLWEIINYSTDWLAGNPVPKLGFHYLFQGGILYPVLMAYFLTFAWVGLRQLFFGYNSASGLRRNQLKYIFFSTLVGFGGGSFGFALGYNIDFYPLNPFGAYGVALYTIIFAYAVLKYRLMDINLAVTRAGIFGVIYAVILGIPYWIGLKILGQGPWVFPVTLMAAFATIGPFIYQFTRKRAEEIILRQQHAYQKTLKELSEKMTQIRDLDKLLKLIVLKVADTVKVDFAAIYMKDESSNMLKLKDYYPKRARSRFKDKLSYDGELTKKFYVHKKPLTAEELQLKNYEADNINSSDLFIPCFFENELLGFMLLGPKPNKQMYTLDDIVVFETLSYAFSLAVENCRFWQEVEDRQRKARLQEMDAYSYSLAHEIDNPVQVILGESELLKKEFLKDLDDEKKRKEAAESFDFIIEAAERIAGMVKAIRDFGQKTTGKLVPVKVQDIIEGFSKLYLPKLKENGIALEKNVDKAVLSVYLKCEKPQLLQVLVIFANNAIHAMKYAAEKKVTLGARLSKDSVLISFFDTGCGIDKELIPIIFTPFTTTKASSEGTGMGLYNAKKIIEAHKGEIWVESEGKNKGAAFFIKLPLAPDLIDRAPAGEEGKRIF